MSDDLTTDPTGAATPSYVDWGFAKTAGRRLVQAGPSVSPAEAREAVEQIRALAAEAVEPVAATSRMHAPGAAPAPVVIDRPTVPSYRRLVVSRGRAVGATVLGHHPADLAAAQKAVREQRRVGPVAMGVLRTGNWDILSDADRLAY